MQNIINERRKTRTSENLTETGIQIISFMFSSVLILTCVTHTYMSCLNNDHRYLRLIIFKKRLYKLYSGSDVNHKIGRIVILQKLT